MYSPSIQIQCEFNVAVLWPLRHMLNGVLPQSSSQLHQPAKSNPRCECYVLDPLANTNSTFSPHTLLAPHRSLNIIPSEQIDFKEQAYIRKQAARRTAERLPTCGAEFFMDFAFMRSSTDDYKHPNKATDRIVTSYDGHSSHLIVVDGASRWVWEFLTKSKEPPLDILRSFMTKFGIGNGVVWIDQGGELARSKSFRDMMLSEFGYVVEPTGADSPSQNGGAKIYNITLAVKVRTLLYGSSLSAKFWSAALLHAVYLHNRLVHSATNKTPYEGWYGRKPDVTHLKTFGSRVCVKRTGS